MFQHFPDWVLYTELVGSGTGGNGRMRLASEIKVKWIEKKIPLLSKIDLNRLELAGEKPNVNSLKRKAEKPLDIVETLIHQNKIESKIKEKQETLNKDDKINAARERYLERKRQKLKE